jgi:DNA polymerase I-like protein with 3'-5' exonuclease and polymerase domains
MICHASNYGMKAGAFQLNVLEKSRGKIALSRQEAEAYLDTYHRLFPEIHEWHDEVTETLSKSKTLYNLFGFPREFTGAIDDNKIKSAYAFVPQSTVGTITNIAFTKLQNYIEDNNLPWDLLANTHDSYMGQCPLGQEQEFARKQKEFIEIELMNFRGEKFRMKSETQCGFNWAPYKKLKNPTGLVEMKGL